METRKARKKILPGLGGLGKTKINKYKCLTQILIFLGERLGELEISGKMPNDEKKTLKKIKEDIIRISKFKSRKSTDFHLECLNIIEKY
jgi:hypothetical protein